MKSQLEQIAPWKEMNATAAIEGRSIEIHQCLHAIQATIIDLIDFLLNREDINLNQLDGLKQI